MYDEENYDNILSRMLNNAPTNIDKSEGSFVFDAISPIAVELAQAYIELAQVLVLAFASTTNGIYLDMRANEHGVTRKAATFASGSVTVEGISGILIPLGTIFITAGGIQFASTTDVSIPPAGTVDIPVTAVLAGISGNVPSGAITSVQVTINGITNITNNNAVIGGADQESDIDLLARLLAQAQSPGTSGNISHYKQWARSVSGVGDAKVFPLWNGNGTVKVCIINSDKQPALLLLVTAVHDYIETQRPICVSVTCESATGLNINISATLVLASGYTINGVKPVIESGIADYLKSIAFTQNYVSYAKIGNVILDTPGVLDYSNFKINNGTANISIGEERVAVLGAVTLA